MNKDEDMDFVFGSREDDAQQRDEAIYGDINKLGHRITLFAVILPCIIGIILVFGYFDIKSRMAQVSDSGSQEVKNVSQDMERSLSQLQVRQAKLEKNLNKRVAEINQSISSVKKKIRKAEKNIDFLAASKANKKGLSPQIKELKSSLASLGEDLQAVSAKTDTLNTKLKTSLKQAQRSLKQNQTKFENRLENKLENELVLKGNLIAENLQKLQALEKGVALVQKERLDTNTLNLALKKERIIYKVKLDQLKGDLKKEIDLIKFAAPEKKTGKSTLPTDIIEQDITN